jgi:hypothetical protein
MFTRQSSRRSLSTKANIIKNEDTNLSQLIIFSNESYGIEFPKTQNDLLQLKFLKNIEDFVIKGKVKIKLKNSNQGEYFVEKETDRQILPIEQWLTIVKKAHGENHYKAENIIEKMRGFMIPVEAIYYLMKFCCSDSFKTDEKLNESVLMFKKSKLGSVG